MSVPRPPAKARLVIGFFMKDRDMFAPLAKTMETEYGDFDTLSPWFPFDETEYYAPEMGSPLFRRMISFREPVDQDRLCDIKLFTNGIENLYAKENRRVVNIDPGYLLPERFILATGKNFTHRVYIGKGIYADLTLIYQNGDFRTLPWTYPDYAKPAMLSYLRQVRQRYLHDRKEKPI